MSMFWKEIEAPRSEGESISASGEIDQSTRKRKKSDLEQSRLADLRMLAGVQTDYEMYHREQMERLQKSESPAWFGIF